MFTLPTIKEMVLAQLSINPDISLKDCQKVVKGLKKSNFYKIKRERELPSEQSEQPRGKKRDTSKNSIPPVAPSNPHAFIDDPDELLMSVAKRMLNMPNPDPRWATILINCLKENIQDKNEVSEQLRNVPTQSLVNILKKNSQDVPL